MLTKETELYIKQLCSMNGHPWEQIQTELFEGQEDKAKINEIFFSLPPKKINETSITREHEGLLRNIKIGGLTVKDRHNLFDQNEKEYIEFIAHANARLAKMNKISSEIMEIEKSGKAPDCYSSVMEALGTGKWKIIEVGPNHLKFAQTMDTILPWVDKVKAVDQKINIGKFMVNIQTTGEVKIYPYQGNILVKGYYHPHIMGNGWVCWGNATTYIGECFGKGDVAGILDMVDVFLHEYNDKDPYRSFMEWIGNEKNRIDNSAPEFLWTDVRGIKGVIDLNTLNNTKIYNIDPGDGNGKRTFYQLPIYRTQKGDFLFYTNEGQVVALHAKAFRFHDLVKDMEAENPQKNEDGLMARMAAVDQRMDLGGLMNANVGMYKYQFIDPVDLKAEPYGKEPEEEEQMIDEENQDPF